MAQNLVINGVTYNGVESLSIPKSGGGNAEFVDSTSATTNTKTYEITLAKASGKVLLTALDDDVLAHINDETFTASLIRQGAYEYVWYSGSYYFVGNRIIGHYGTSPVPVYGTGQREQSENNCTYHIIAAPANSTSSTLAYSGAYGQFYISNGKYYIIPGDGYIKAGTYKLTFSW